MVNIESLVNIIIEKLEEKGVTVKREKNVPIGVSNRHIHLSAKDLETCFGTGYILTPIKDLSQPGQFACKETVTISGPKGSIDKVRVLGPVRSQTQVELIAADNFKLGIKAPLRLSGRLNDSAPITIEGPCGKVELRHGAIVAQRHIHMTEEDAKQFCVFDGQSVKIEVDGERGGVYGNVVVRVTDSSALDCHIDTEEANAMGITSESKIRILK